MNLLRRRPSADPTRYRHAAPVTIRWARADDAADLETLAELDEAPLPPPPLMLGLVEDELWAAVSVSSGSAICDPFKPSAEVARLAAERGRQLTVPAAARGFGPRQRRPSAVGLKAHFGQGAV